MLAKIVALAVALLGAHTDKDDQILWYCEVKSCETCTTKKLILVQDADACIAQGGVPKPQRAPRKQ